MSCDAVVVGAGFAGLSAAVDLAGRGLRVIVLEARPHLGGRATSYRDRVTGDRVDNGQHVLFGCYRETFRFLARLGMAAEVEFRTPLMVESVDTDGTVTRLDCPHLPPPFHLVGGILEWDRLPVTERAAVLRMLGPVRRAGRDAAGTGPPAPGEAEETVRDWLVRLGQGPRIRELLWEPLALAALNQPPDRAAARPFAQVLTALCGPRVTDAAIGLPRRPLDQLYAEPARRFIENRGGEVRTGVVARARVDGRRLSGVDAGSEPILAGATIVAVPWHAIGSCFPDRPPALAPTLAAAAATAGSPIVTVNLWLDRRLLPGPFLGLPGRTMQWAFDTRRAFGAEASHLSMVSSGADQVYRLSNRALVDLAVTELRAALGATGWRVEHASVIRERNATFSLAPGQPPRPETRTGVDGLFLAGDWIETGLPGTIEGAVISGHRAAAAACEQLSP